MVQELEPPYATILSRLKQGRVIPFFGSGSSLGCRIPGVEWKEGATGFLPTSGELAKYLARMAQFPSEEPIDLAKVAQYYNLVSGRQVLDDELRNIFNRDYSLTVSHTFIATIRGPLLIVTTNYDDCIERAFDAEGNPYDVVVHTIRTGKGDRLLWYRHGESEPLEVISNKFIIDLESRNVIYKMHGTVDRHLSSRDHFLITEDDYIDFLSRMIKNSAIPAIFAEPFQHRSFLFLGYGLNDWNLRVVLNRIEKDLRRGKNIKSWAIRKNVKPLERRFWQERGVEVYDMNVEDFITTLGSFRGFIE